MMFALSASAQVQLLFMEGGRNVIDRNKKMYWMDGDDDPCYNILNYKKSGRYGYGRYGRYGKYGYSKYGYSKYGYSNGYGSDGSDSGETK